jgi:hypothetical protein
MSDKFLVLEKVNNARVFENSIIRTVSIVINHMVSMSEFNIDLLEISNEDDTNEFNHHKLYQSISSDKQTANK